MPWVFKSKGRLFSTLLILFSIPTLILMYSVFLVARRQLVEGAIYQNFTTARLVANLVDEEFFGLSRYVEAISRRASITAFQTLSKENQTKVLKGVVLENRELFRAVFADPEGAVIADYPHVPDTSDENVKSREWFQGTANFNRPYVSNVHQSSGPGNPYVVTVAEKVKDDQGRTIGFLAGQYPVSELRDAIVSITPSSEAGEIVIFDRRHNQIVSSPTGLIPRASIDSLLKEDRVKQTFLIGEKKYFGTHLLISSVEWNVLVFQPAVILFEPLYELIHATLALLLIVLLATALIGWRWHKTIFSYATELRRSYEYLEGFCYSITHDLYAPARAIQGFAGVITDELGEKLGAEGRDYISRISKAGQRMTALVNALLEYGAIAHTPIHLEFLDARQILLEAAERLHHVVEAKKARIEVTPYIPQVAADQKVLKQIFIHLLSNALKFSKPEVSPVVKIWSQETRQTVRIWIEDNGIGIDPRYQEMIFGVFQTLHRQESFLGTGIGLAITRKGLERLGGRIGLNSIPGEGSSFWIELSKE